CYTVRTGNADSVRISASIRMLLAESSRSRCVPMTSPAIETKDLQKTYRSFLRRKPVPALQGVSLRVEPGTIFGLIGQNGAGKTTLVKILLGLSRPTGGSATLLGASPQNSTVRRRVGYLPEQMRIPEYLTAKSFLRYMGRLNGVSAKILGQRIPELIERVGLAGVKKPVKSYSKGMQQRLGLAQALLNDPEVLFLDEPTDGLDPLGRKDVRDLLVSLRAASKTIFLNSHILSEIELVCDQIVILNRGEVARVASPAEFTRGTGEYLVRVTAATDAVRAAAAAVLGASNGNGKNGHSSKAPQPNWTENTLRFSPRDREQLNALIDRLRSAQAEIDAVEPVRLSLEQFFLQVVGAQE
ncbi:MAG: ABC transporter ATP-binding protein, partial [Candidatus Sulfotelmatobacter sp.]